MFWWVVTPILTFYLKMSTGVPIDRISHHIGSYLEYHATSAQQEFLDIEKRKLAWHVVISARGHRFLDR